MTSRFSELWRASYPLLPGSFGEAFRHLPKARAADPNAPPVVDPDRIERDVVGIYMDRPERLNMPDAHDQRTDKRPGVMAGEPSVEIDTRRWPGMVLKRGDHLRRATPLQTFRVTEVAIDDEGISVAHVTLVG